MLYTIKRKSEHTKVFLVWNLFCFLIQAGDLFQDLWNTLVLNLVLRIKSGS